MATIATSTNASPFAYPGNTLLDMRHGFQMAAMVKTSTANTYQVFLSVAPWTTWTAYTSTVRASIVDSGSIFISNDDWLYWCYRTNEASEDRIYLRRLSMLNGVWSSEILVAVVGNGGVAGAIYGGLDMQLVISAVHTYVAVAVGTTAGCGVHVLGVHFFPNGTSGVDHGIVSGTHTWAHPGSGRIGPSIDIEHNGDGKSSGAPHLWVAFGRDRLMMVKCAWNGGGWSGPVQAQELLGSGMAAREYTAARWDGNEFLIVVPNPTSGATDTVLLVERDRANSTTTTRTSPVHPTGVIRHTSLSYDTVTRNVRVYAIGTSTTVLYYVDYLRGTGLWTSWATVLATAVLGSTGQEWGVRRGSYGDAKHDVYTAHASNALVHTGQTLTYAPFTPTWINTTGQSADVAVSLVLDWEFTDADAADSQKDFALSRQVGAGALEYWRTSDNTWQVAEVKNASGTSALTLTATQWSLDGAANGATDPPHTYKVKVWDQSNTPSSYSDGLVVIPSAVVNPTITAPTPAQVITSSSVTITWTIGQQASWGVQLLTNPGGAQVYDSGWVSGSATSHTVAYVLPDNTAWTLALDTRNAEGLRSVQQTVNITVDYLEPNTPTNVNTPSPANGWIAVVITNPAPSGGRPAPSTNDLYRRPVGDTSDGVRVAVGVAVSGTYNDWQAVSGVSYEYRVLTRGVNGTSIYGAWQT